MTATSGQSAGTAVSGCFVNGHVIRRAALRRNVSVPAILLTGKNGNPGFDLNSKNLHGVMVFDPGIGAVRKYEINAQLDLTVFGKKMPGSISMRTVLTKFEHKP